MYRNVQSLLSVVAMTMIRMTLQLPMLLLMMTFQLWNQEQSQSEMTFLEIDNMRSPIRLRLCH